MGIGRAEKSALLYPFPRRGWLADELRKRQKSLRRYAAEEATSGETSIGGWRIFGARFRRPWNA